MGRRRVSVDPSGKRGLRASFHATRKRGHYSADVPIKGTLAVVLLAKQRHLIPSAKILLLQLRSNGYRIDETLLSTALAALGEA